MDIEPIGHSADVLFTRADGRTSRVALSLAGEIVEAGVMEFLDLPPGPNYLADCAEAHGVERMTGPMVSVVVRRANGMAERIRSAALRQGVL